MINKETFKQLRLSYFTDISFQTVKDFNYADIVGSGEVLGYNILFFRIQEDKLSALSISDIELISDLDLTKVLIKISNEILSLIIPTLRIGNKY